MGRKCCVPKCKQGYQGTPNDPNVTFHLFRNEWKPKIHREENWEVTALTYICSKHFIDRDFFLESVDTNKDIV